MGQGVSDIVQRLRDRAYSSKVPDPLCEQAATEIERLRHVVMFGMDALLRNGAVLGRATDHDAAPAARAVSTDDRTDKAAPSQCRDRPGDTPVTEPMPKEKRAEVSDRSKPIADCDTLPQQPTPGDCSKPREGTSEPVAWAVVYPTGDVAVIAFKRQDADDRATASDRVVPLYSYPPPTLTDAEREAIGSTA